MRIIRFVFFCLCLLLAFNGLAAPAETFRVPMSDGVTLATDLYLPTGDGPWPVVLERTPYDRKHGGLTHANLLPQGYAVVIQNLRGTLDSDGVWEVFRTDGWNATPGYHDGLDTVDWLLKQPWCNGKIGLAGWSASGIAAQLLMAAHPKGVRCAYIGAASDTLYETIFPNGCYRLNTIEAWPQGKSMINTFVQHPAYDDFWRSYDARARAKEITIPVYITCGWFDLFQRSATAFFQQVNNNGHPQTHGKCKLLMGTKAHGGASGALPFTAAGQTNPERLIGPSWAWLAYWLKEEDHGILEKPAVAFFVMGDDKNEHPESNVWRTLNNWPPPHTPHRLYLHSDGILHETPPKTENSATAYTYNPEDPTPSFGGNNLYPPSGPQNQREIEAREDVISFDSPPFISEKTFIGPITVTLHVSSDVTDTDFGARLCDVYPDGRSMNMNEGMVRTRYRDDRAKETLMNPGEIYSLSIALGETALTVAKGHRLRLDIFSCAHPRYEANPNTGEAFRKHTRSIPAHNKIHHTLLHPSHIILPLNSQ